VRGVPGRVEDLPPDCLMAFGSPIAIRFYYHRLIMSSAPTPVKGSAVLWRPGRRNLLPRG